MSEATLISPLLDSYSMGNPISTHDGITCCPAIIEGTDKKYIVKIISVPASQAQMDALLLAGAYADPADAMEYFRRQCEDIIGEAEFLKKLAATAGFLSYDRWQMEPITRHRLGYQIYLVGSYKRSLDKYVRHNPVTHLEAMNLGLDLCAALSACRQAGRLYVDLKPANIYLSDKKEYRIGDLGFVPLDALRYTVIPDRYRSVYTPPELHDPMATLNMTVDTYAVGMILYQLYNDGQLPFTEKAPQEALPVPINADYELCEIIMRSIHPDPFQRWNDPKDLEQALREYMQRNTINNDPITVHTPLEISSEEGLLGSEFPPEGEQAPASPEADDTAPGEEDAQEVLPHEMSEEVSKIVAKADDLISHETPAGVVLPEIPDPPDPFAFAKDEDAVEEEVLPKEPLIEDPEKPPQGEPSASKEPKFISPEVKRLRKKRITTAAALLAIAAVVVGSFLFYRFFYLQPVREISLDIGKDQVAVAIDSDISDSLLHLSCTDSSGNVLTSEITNGSAAFTGLNPDSTYTLELVIGGFHHLTGQTTTIFNTDATTNVSSFTSTVGSEDGSLILSFTVEGDEPEEWSVSITADGEEPRIQTFSGHSITVTDLTVGKTYTFTLSAADTQSNTNISVSGETTLEQLASKLILAKNLTVRSADSSSITLEWEIPGDVVVENWTVQLYDSASYDEEVTVEETEATFTGVDLSKDYTIEITAAGMTQPASFSLPANTTQVGTIQVENADDVSADTLDLSWAYTGNAPSGGWLLTYQIDGTTVPNVLQCEDASASLDLRIPGAEYTVTLQAADSSLVINSSFTYQLPQSESFSAYKLSAENVEGWLLKTPESNSWHYGTISTDEFTSSFTAADRISAVIHCTTDFYLPGNELEVMTVIRDAEGKALPELTGTTSTYWDAFWETGDYHYAELSLAGTPSTAGSYTVDIYFDGKLVTSLPFTIS